MQLVRDSDMTVNGVGVHDYVSDVLVTIVSSVFAPSVIGDRSSSPVIIASSWAFFVLSSKTRNFIKTCFTEVDFDKRPTDTLSHLACSGGSISCSHVAGRDGWHKVSTIGHRFSHGTSAASTDRRPNDCHRMTARQCDLPRLASSPRQRRRTLASPIACNIMS